MSAATRERRQIPFWRIGAVLLLGLGGAAALFLQNATPEGPWQDGEERGQFRSVYHGFGSVTGDDDAIVIEPQPAKDLSITHGGLVVTTQVFDGVDFDIEMTTEEQVRRGSPNPWEVGWVLWNYTDDDHFYAVSLKPNGWEISKQDPAYPGKQRFLATGNKPTFPVGEKNLVSVKHTGNEMGVEVNGEVLGTVIDEETPYRTGAIGLYTEDARVRFENLTIAPTTN